MESTSTLTRFLGKVRTFDTLRYYRDFRLLLASSLLYSTCIWMLIIVMGWLAYELTGSVFLVAVFGAVSVTPQVFGPFVGALVDMIDRKKLLITVRALQAVFAGILAILSATGLLEFWHLVVIGFFQGVIMTASFTAYSTITMDIVGKENISNAVSLSLVVMNVTRVIGPAAGGALIAFLGPATTFGIAALLASLATVSLFPLALPARTMVSGQGSVFRELAQGFKYVIHNRDMLSVIAITFVANLFVWPAYASFMPVFAKDNLGLDALGLGILTSGFGVGALIGALIIASMGNFKGKGLLYLLGTLLFALFFGAFVLSGSFPLALFLVGVAGLASSGFGIMQSTLTLILAPEDMRGRSMGFLMLAIGGMSVGSLALGVVANVIGASLATAISCALLVASILAIVAWAPNLRRL